MLNNAAIAIDDFVARGVFRADAPQVGAAGMTTWHIRWFGGHVIKLAVSEREVSIAPLLPPLDARSPLYRELSAWLRAQQSAELPVHRRLDPARYTLDLRNRGGEIRLTLRVTGEAPDTLVRRAVQLVNAVYLDFLNGPGRLEWQIEAFGLDPDNPRLS